MESQKIIKIVCTILTAFVAVLSLAFGLTSCNVTRTITTTASTFQKGDTCVTIQTKTTEVYDASKRL